MTMEQRLGLMYTSSSRLPVLTNKYALRPPRRLPQIMENVSRPRAASKSVMFYKNGDRYFQGHHVVVTQRKYRSFDNLLTELTRVTKLPHGVRFLLTPTTGRRVETLEALEDGKSYIASSFTKLKRLHYGSNFVKNDDESNNKKEIVPRKIDNIKLKPLHYNPESKNRENKKRSPIPTTKTVTIRPRLITVIRNGFRPRRVVKVLLNRRTAQTFEQVLDDVTSAVGVIGGSGVRKLFTIDGKLVHGLSDLLGSEVHIFVAVGDEKFHAQDLQDIIKESNLTPVEQKHKHHRKTSHHDKNFSLKIASSVQSLKEIEDNELHSNASSRLTFGDESTVSNKNSIKSNRVKLPHIKELDQNPVVQANYSEISNSQKEKILPPIDVNNNKQTDYNKRDQTNSNKQKVNIEEGIKIDNVSVNEKDEEKSPRKEEIKNDLEKKQVKNIRDLFEIGKKLGDGNFAVVRECIHKVSSEKYALKIIDRSKLKGKEKMLDNEIQIMKRCNHPNIVKLFDDFHADTEIYLVMELVPGGDLFDAISNAVKFDEQVSANYVHDICSSLHYLHKRKIVHRDLKPENLMVCEGHGGKKTLKLADFGLAMEVKEPIYTVCGTPTYVAPEILRESGYGLRVDMWAAGVIAYIMLCGFPPFRSTKRRQSELFDLIQTGSYEFLSPYWDEVSDDAKDFVSCLLVVDIPKRYSAEQALNHPWVKGKISQSRGTTSINDEESTTESNFTVSKFKSAAISIQSVQRLKMLAADFQEHRGEKILTHVK